MMRAHLGLTVALMLPLVLGAPPACAQKQPSPPAEESQAEQGMPETMFADAGALLDALETADADLRTLQSRINYMRIKALALDVEARVGTLYFTSEPAQDEGRPQRMFALDFAQRWVGSTLQNNSRTVLVFDGQRLFEKNFADKLMQVRTVVRPGEAERDPLRLGEGPLPIPIGQRKADIMRVYEAQIAPELTEGLETPVDAEEMEARVYDTVRKQVTEHPDRTVQLHLTARSDQDDLTEIRLWYRRGEDGRLLPMLARAVAADGDISVIQLAGIRINEPFDAAAEEAMATQAPPGWKTEIRDF